MFIVPTCGTGRINRVRGDWNRLLGDFFISGIHSVGEFAGACRVPPVNVWEEGDNFFVEAELPGMSMDDIQVLVMDNKLTIKGAFGEQGLEEASVLRRERRSGAFERVFQLPVDIDAQKVQAQLRAGLLKVTLPKAASAQPKKIQIDVSE